MTNKASLLAVWAYYGYRREALPLVLLFAYGKDAAERALNGGAS